MAVLDEVHQEVTVVVITNRCRTQPDDLGLRATVLAQPAHRELTTAQGVFTLGLLSDRRHRCLAIRRIRTGHKLVDEPAGGVSGTGDQGCSHTESVDGGAT